MKRFIGFLCLVMFMIYGIKGLYNAFNLYFYVFYISLCVITIWIAFRFMTAEKILKYDVITKLTHIGAIKDVMDNASKTEEVVENQVQEVPKIHEEGT